MYQIGEFLSQYATKEVLTVIGVLATAWMGWKVAAKSLGFVSSIAKKASFMGLAATVMLIGGLGTTGLGIGELWSRPEPVKQTNVALSNDDLLRIIRNESSNPEVIKTVLEYAKQRDKIQQEERTVAAKVSNPKLEVTPVAYDYDQITIDSVKNTELNESVVSLPFAWSLIGIGLASAISGLAVYGNRNSKRNPEDPHFSRA